ncbi:outer membrane protein assembly factor BamD [Candidatus Pantoea edessiphila]|uniref:Outer membrane protein assembly factor BamD n=1 Tax=Candidatus Pantoea edessiphila TaxID=2044610 RepID=A0A2P5SZL4_9GAMM|nr:outer membrane protein assembly factor BamD [Candidatus Pantoea edessiphila]PPI87742.1 outer membrane protein assembly factor BamD [Candidatus Pantoea edessiphila]
MKKIKYLLTIFLVIMMMSCSICNQTELSYDSLYKIYKTAQKKMQEGNFISAIKYLESIKNIDLFRQHTQQIQLDLIYAYYKNMDLESSENAINHFMNVYPNHPNVDYLLYMKGLIGMSMDNPATMKFFHFDNSSRDPEYAYNAFSNFVQLIKYYPKSIYVNDAYNRLIFLKNRLAKYELSVALFYHKHRAYVSVINRVKKMMIYYPDTKATHNALLLMAEAYRKLNINDEADKIFKIIDLNH